MLGLLLFLLNALWWLIVVDSVLSFVMPPDQFPRSLTTSITDPLYAPIRTVLKPERTGGLDLSPLFILFLISIVQRMVAHSL